MSPKTALSLMIVPFALAACSAGEAQGPAERGEERTGMMGGRSGGAMGGGMMEGMDGRAMGAMRTIRALLAGHEAIERRVERVPGGVRTVTVSDDPEIASLIRRHVREMRARYERDRPIRTVDPVFRALFRHRDEARMEIEDVPGGVRVVHTSDLPAVAALIRQHAERFVSEAADQGMRRAMRPTPLPPGYAREEGGAAR